MAAVPVPHVDRDQQDAAIRAFLVATLRERRQKKSLLLLSMPVPWLQLEPLWAALPAEPAMLWDAAGAVLGTSGEACLGIGEVTALSAEHTDRQPEPLGDVERLAPPGHAPGTLRWLCGRSFAGASAGADADAEPPWTEFPAAIRMLPRWCYTRGPDGSRLHLAVYAPTDALIAQVEAEFQLLSRAGAQPLTADASPPEAPLHSEPLPLGHWQTWIDSILAAIAAEQVEKVVAVRRTTLIFPRAIDVPTVLARLRAQAPQSIRFALRRGRATFIGATPELLLRKRGRTITTDALAGTLSRRNAPLAELSAQLLASDKDHREHALVVTAIKQCLAPLCSDISAPPSPQIRALPYLVHLHTPIRATTRAASTQVLELVAALHPTPAVGGTPTQKALQLIAALEPQPRGYYAGPIGWYDEHGDGEFAVAIRSGVVTGDTAYVYGGAGIVRGSEPAAEYAETAAKMRTLLYALGVPPDFTELAEAPR